MKTNRLLAIAIALVASLLVLVPVVPSEPVSAAGILNLTKVAPLQVLAGEPINYSLQASNTGDAAFFNVTFRDVLEPGVTYSGPTTPAAAGEPQVITNTVTVGGVSVQQQTLIWSNVADLQPNSSFSLSYGAIANAVGTLSRPDVHVVGAVIPNTGEVYGSTDPRVVPTFTSTGAPPTTPQESVVETESNQVTTTLTAVEIVKDSDSAPEGELLRGVHDHTARYTLTVDVTALGSSSQIAVTDTLPPQLEFLGCGGVDNSTVAGGQRPEYTDAPLLTAGRTLVGDATCIAPSSVDTQPDGSTLVTWTGLPPLTDPNQPLVISYLAAIPLFANAPFPAGTAPTPVSLGQASNLDNNTGASTRELAGSEASAVNQARVDALFSGQLEPGAPVNQFDTDELVRTIEDVRVRKEVVAPTGGVFDIGGIARYRVTVETSEYMTASNIALTDTVPNGLCPLVQAGFVGYPEIVPSADVAGCTQVSPSPTPTQPIQSVTARSGGGFDAAFAPIASLPVNGSATVEYSTYMRSTYQGGAISGRPTVDGDNFSNTVTSKATTTGRPGLPPAVSGPIPEVADGSDANLTTGSLSIFKDLLPRDVAPRLNAAVPAGDRCPDSTTAGTGVDQYIPANGPPTAVDVAKLGFRVGDQICFRLRVDFDTRAQTRNAVVSDFVPLGTRLVAGSIRNTARDNVESTNTSSPPDGPLVWTIGTPTNGADIVDTENRMFEVVFAVEVTAVPPTDTPLLTGNLMKMRTENSLGQAQSFRDVANFGIVPAPPIRVVKGVERVVHLDGSTTGPNGANSNIDGTTVQQGSQVRFRIDLTNLGEAQTFDQYSVRRVETLDVLPPQVRCSAITSITNFGTVTDLGQCIDPGQTVGGFTNTSSTQSVIRWAFDESDAYALFPVGEPQPSDAVNGTRSLFYTMTIPSPTSVSTRFDNTAGVRTYGTFTNLEGQTSPNFIPANNIDPSLNSQANAEPARDTSWVITPDAAVGKFVTSWISQTNNNRSQPAPPEADAPFSIVGDSAQAVVGEYVTYRYFVDVPAQTTVFNASLTDQLPTPDNGAFVIVPIPPLESGAPAASAVFYGTAGTGTPGALPAGVSFDPATGTITFPATYNNATATAQRFEVVLSARVADTGLGATDEPTRTNTARFNSNATLGGAALTAVQDTAAVQIRQPVPSLAKVATEPDDQPLPQPDNIVAAGQIVKYTLTASNGADRPPLHDTWLVDCVPNGLEDVTILDSQPDDIGPVPGDATNGCDPTETYIAFKIGSLAGGASVARQYTAMVSDQSVGGEVYPNTATLTGSSLDNGKSTPQAPDDLTERSYEAAADESVRVLGALLEKSVTPDRATIGEDVEFTIEVTVPPNTNFYQAAIVDRLPPGYTLGSPLDPQVTCVFEDGSLCEEPVLEGVLGPDVDGSAQVVAFYLGDVVSRPTVRILTITYTATVANVPANAQDVTLTNTARAAWDLVNSDTDPTSPLYPWTVNGRPDDATVTIIEPKLTITKSTPDLTIEPGQEFTYSIRVTNTGASTAYNTVITDTIPAGIELVPVTGTSPGQGGTVSGKTITWNIGSTSLDPTEWVTLSYSAKLVASSGISASTPATSFRNNAQVTRYTSLADGTDTAGRVYTGPSSNVTITPQFPRLATTKTRVTANPVYIGEPVTWQIVTTNQSPAGTASTTRISDTLPPNWTFDSTTSIVRNPGNVPVTPTSFTETDDPAGDQLVWTLGTLAAGQNYTVRFTATPGAGVDIPPVLPATFTNRTTSIANDGSGASGNQGGAYTASSSATANIDRVDLALDKSHATAPVAGENFSWSIVVRNNGPSTAVGPFTVTDAIPTAPTGVTFASAGGTGWTCTPATGPASPATTGTVACARAVSTDTLASGAAFEPITFTVRIPSDTPDGTQISNTATVGGQRTYERLSDLPNNTDTDQATIITRANLRIVKTLVTPPGLIAGTNSTYNLAITNLGPSTSRATSAQPIVVRDTLPPTVSFVSATDIAGTPTFTCSHDNAPTGGVVTCNRATDMLLNAASDIRIVVRVPSGLTGDLTNTGTVTPAITTDPTPGNNTSTITNPIVEQADLGIVKTALGPNVPGEPTTYRLSVTNNGPGDATVRIQDALPAGLTYRSFSNVAGNWTCVASTAPDPVPGFRCVLAGKLTFTASPLNIATVDVVVNTAPSVTGTVRNTAVVSTTATDTNPNNNIAIADLAFAGVADLAVTKTATSTPVVPGGPIGWTVNVSNLGPSDSQPTIRVDDQLPVGVIGPVTAAGVTEADDWTCTVSPTPLVSCTKATRLAAGTNTNIRITAVVDPATGGPASITNSATVFPTTTDPTTANNTGTVAIPVAEPAVTLAKSVSTATPQPGELFTYTMTLTNASGAATAYNMRVSDVLPPGIVWVSGGTLTDNTVNWTVQGPLAGGASTTVSFVARLAPSPSIDTSAITNIATLDSYESLASGGRTYTGNSDDAVVTPVFPNLVAAKVALGSNPTYIDDQFAWQITITNSGGGDAARVDVTDLLPRNWTYVPGSTTVTTPTGMATPDPTVIDINAGAAIIDQRLVWSNLGALTQGQSLTVAFRAVPTSAVGTDPGVGSDEPHTNRASAVTTDNSGASRNLTGDYVSNTATANAFIDSADLEIQKLNAATPAIAGTNYSWTLKVRNLGEDAAVGPFTVVDTLPTIAPTPLTLVSANGTGWNCSYALVITCTRGGSLPAPAFTDDPAAAFPDITVTVAIPSDYLTTGMTNTATVAARTFDPATPNNTATAVTPVLGVADLAIAKRHTNLTVTAGSNITYELVVTNNGPSTSRSTITVVDTLPANTTFVSASNTAAGDAWNCVNGVPSAGRVTCTLTGDILTSAPAEAIHITVRLGSNASPSVDVVNSAQVVPGATPEGAVNPSDPNDPKIRNNVATDIVRPTTSADLVMNKSHVGALVPGALGVYRLRVDNVGPSDANAPTITDTLPLGLTFAGYTSNPGDVVGAAPGVWTCTATSADQRTFQCTLDRPLVTPGFSVVDIDVDIVSTLLDPIVNFSTVTSTTPDPITGNNTDSDDSTVTTLADLAIVKTGPNAPVIAGDTFNWTLTVTNNGPSVSRQPIRVVDSLPDTVALVTDVTTIPAPWVCTSAPATVAGYSTEIACTLSADLAAPVNAPANVAPPITFTVRALPQAGPAEITNSSTVSGTTNEPNTPEAGANNSSQHEVTLIDNADLQIVKTPATQTVRAGENATFTLTVTNNGLSTADDVIVNDPLPSGMTIALPFTVAGWDCSLSTTVAIDCRRPTLDPGAAPAITVVALVGAGVPETTELLNTATVASSTKDDVPANNTSSAKVIVNAEADLAVTKTHPGTPDPVDAGTTLEFHMVVTNNGPSDAVAPITVTDTLPDGFSFLSASGSWTCVPTGADPQVIVCTKLGGGLFAGATDDSLYVLTQIDPSLDAGEHVNTAVAGSTTTDPDLDNNTATDPVNVGTVADVSIVKSHDPDDVRIGEEFSFTLAVYNDGPSEARDVVVTDTVPDSLAVVDIVADADVWDCSASSGQDVSCELVDPLPPLDDASITVVVLVAPEAFPGVDNTATVETSTTDPDPADNSSTDDVVVPRLVDLYVTKSHDADAVHVGEPVVFTVTVGNNGPIDDDAEITVTDTMPAGLVPTAATSDDADCAIAGAIITCTKADGLAVDETFTITITADVTPAAYPLAVNEVGVSSPTDDVDETNNTAIDPVVVPPLVDLAIAKTHAAPVQVGGRITYTLTVTNNGPTTAPPPVRVLDTLPGSLTPVSAESAAMACDITGQTVACETAAALGVGDTINVTILADVGPAAYPSVENTATVTIPGCSITPLAGPVLPLHTCADPDLTNNSATDVATVTPLVRLELVKSLASQVGSTATWSFDVRNAGPNPTVEPIRLIDNLPTALTFVSATGDGWQCSHVTQVVACIYAASVAPGSSAPLLQIVTTMSGIAAGTQIVNVATVGGGGPDVPAVSDDAVVIAPKGLPNTGGGAGILLRWAPTMVLIGLAMVIIARRRRDLDLAT